MPRASSKVPSPVRSAKLFKHGGSQAVRLPKEFRFEGTEVLVSRKGDHVILSRKPGKPRVKLGQRLKRAAGMFSPDFQEILGEIAEQRKHDRF